MVTFGKDNLQQINRDFQCELLWLIVPVRFNKHIGLSCLTKQIVQDKDKHSHVVFSSQVHCNIYNARVHYIRWLIFIVSMKILYFNHPSHVPIDERVRCKSKVASASNEWSSCSPCSFLMMFNKDYWSFYWTRTGLRNVRQFFPRFIDAYCILTRYIC